MPGYEECMCVHVCVHVCLGGEQASACVLQCPPHCGHPCLVPGPCGPTLSQMCDLRLLGLTWQEPHGWDTETGGG